MPHQKKLILVVFLISIISVQQAWAQSDNSEIITDSTNDSVQRPIDFLQDFGKLQSFLMFIGGISLYVIFVWFFYRTLSRRELIPRFYLDEEDDVKYRRKLVLYILAYVLVFPAIIFVFFSLLAYFLFIISIDFPMNLALFVSLTIIAVTRIVSYYKEDAAKEIAKMIPYALLAFFLTSSALYLDPNFITEDKLKDAAEVYVDHLGAILSFMTVVLICELVFRVSFMIKRKIRPVADQKLEESIDQEVEAKLKAHFKKMTDKQELLDKRIQENLGRFKELQDNQKRLMKDLEKRQSE